MLIIAVTYNRIKHSANSICAVINDLSNSAFGHRLVVVDNGSTDGTKECILHLARRQRCDFTFVSYNFNFGKAHAVNLAFEKFTNGQTTLCSFDGDLIPSGDGFFDRLEKAHIYSKNCLGFNVLCANQTGNPVHNFRLLRGICKAPFGNVLYNPKGGSGVAGGCLAIDVNLFRSVGGYRTNTGIYGGNDGLLIADVMAKCPNKRVGMAESISVYHPPEDDIGYERYKKSVVDSIRKTGYGTEKGYYENLGGHVQQ